MQIGDITPGTQCRILGMQVVGTVLGNSINTAAAQEARTNALKAASIPVFRCPPGHTLFKQTSHGDYQHHVWMLENQVETEPLGAPEEHF